MPPLIEGQPRRRSRQLTFIYVQRTPRPPSCSAGSLFAEHLSTYPPSSPHVPTKEASKPSRLEANQRRACRRLASPVRSPSLSSAKARVRMPDGRSSTPSLWIGSFAMGQSIADSERKPPAKTCSMVDLRFCPAFGRVSPVGPRPDGSERPRVLTLNQRRNGNRWQAKGSAPTSCTLWASRLY